jgi:hypothetical protein
MKILAFVCAALFGSMLAAQSIQADDKKEVTLNGTILCAKCALKEAKKCQNAIQVKEGDKTVTYLFDDRGMKESYHDAVCGGEKKEGTVKGTVSTKDGKQIIKPTKVDYAK